MATKKKIGDYKIPFDDDGNQLDYEWGAEVWIDNHEFDDELTYDGYSRGRSSAIMLFKRSGGGGVSMFMTDFNDIVDSMVKGKISGRFTFTKRGQNYGIKCLTVNEPKDD